jgi:CRP/FNR family transcriptional regulator
VTGPEDLCVGRVPIFRGLTDDDLAAVAALARPVRLRRGDVAYTAGAAVGRLLVVHRGRVALTHRSPDGHEQVVRVLQEGDFVGEDAFLSGARPDHDVIAATDAQLCTFSHTDLAGLVHHHPGIALRMLQAVSARLAEADRMLTSLASSDVGARVAGYLLDQATTRDAAGHAVVHLSLAKKDIASYLGTTPESFSRAVTALARAGIVRSDGNAVTFLDPTALESRAHR